MSDENPFNPNITLTISEIEEHNPFKPILGQSPVLRLGEGGYNSGKKIPDNNAVKDYPVGSQSRDRAIWANAQRTYRNRNRDAYNNNMKALWRYNKEQKNASYNNWLLSQSKANEKYRLKKKLMKLEAVNYNDLKTIPSKIKSAVDKSWKSVPKTEKDALTKKQKKSVKQVKTELYKDEFEKQRLNEISDIKSKLGNNTDISKVKNPYAQVDYNNLFVGNSTERKANNLKDLKLYYDTILTTTKPVAKDSDFKEKVKLPTKQMRDAHRNNLTAGNWINEVEGEEENLKLIRKEVSYKKTKGSHPNRPVTERYEAEGKNKI